MYNPINLLQNPNLVMILVDYMCIKGDTESPENPALGSEGDMPRRGASRYDLNGTTKQAKRIDIIYCSATSLGSFTNSWSDLQWW